MAVLTEIDEFQWGPVVDLAPYSSLAEVEHKQEWDLSSIRHFGIDQRRRSPRWFSWMAGDIYQGAVAFYSPGLPGDFAEIEPFLIPRKLHCLPEIWRLGVTLIAIRYINRLPISNSI